MKKFLTIILLLAVSTVSFLIQMVVNLLVVYPLIFPAVIFSAGAAFATSCFYKMFRSNVGLGAPLFWVIAFVPQSAFGLGYLIWAVCMRSMGYWFIGVQGVLCFYDMPVTAVVYALAGGIFAAVQRAIEKKESLSIKKAIAIILLVIIGAAALLFMVIGGMLIGYVAGREVGGGLGLTVQIVIALAGTFGIDRLRVLYREKYDLKAPLFYLCVYAPTVIWAVYSVITSIGYPEPNYGGLVKEMTIVLAGALLWLTASTIMGKVKLNKGGSQSR
ncbi:MAG: hypothetical protein K2G32_02970 [Oscillospiraceae bacterium]|nr:hypothetical protein [Oscillospiraceae bacterium]